MTLAAPAGNRGRARGAPRVRVAPPKLPNDPVTRYAASVVEGRIVAGRLVRLAAQRHVDDLRRASATLRFNRDEARDAIEFFPLALRHWKGELGPNEAEGRPQGERVVLEPWQEFIVGSAFGWERWDPERGRWVRRFRLVYVEIAKKNGKTLMAAGFGLRLAFFDGEPGAEVYSAATKKDQAKLIWRDAMMAVKGSASLSRRIRISAAVSNLSDERTGSKFEPLGQDSGRTDQGFNPNGALVDELHVHANREVWDNLTTAMAARAQPMMVVTTTAGVKRESIWMEVRSDVVQILEGRASDDSVFGFIATLDACDECRAEGKVAPSDGCPRCDDPFDERVWPKANPNLGVSVQPSFLRELAAKAKRSPASRPAFLRFHANIATAASSRWLDIDDWDACEPDVPITVTKAEYEARFAERVPDRSGCYGGLDLATVRDLTALLLIFEVAPGVYDALARFWCPAEGIEERSARDGVPYADWARDGWLIATEGNVTDYDAVEAEVVQLGVRFGVGELAYDRFNATQLVTRLEKEGVPLVPLPQTFLGLSAGAKALDAAVTRRAFRHGRHPILRWMAGNVEIETDAQGNIRPSKSRSSEKIDGIVAATMAMARWIAWGEAPGVWTAA